MDPRLFAGPAAAAGPEAYADHLARLGRLPSGPAAREVIPVLEVSGLLGRGGAGFPVGRKWRSVAGQTGGRPVVLANGAEGEPLSAKDRTLLRLRPHLVLDGALLAADAIGADRIALYIGSDHRDAQASIRRALGERRDLRVAIDLMAAPATYVAGEESAAVHFVNDADARPTVTPPRPYERGGGGRPTLVQNVESLAYAALIARFGDAWYRQLGRGPTRGTALITTGGLSGGARVREIELGVTVGEVAELGDPVIRRGGVQAVLLGGYFGGWLDADGAWALALDPAALRERGLAFGCGLVRFLDAEVCPVAVTARIMTYMAGESAAQCGPCVLGLRSIADATTRIANLVAVRNDLANIERWIGQVRDRGACRHPDGAVGLLARGLEVFGTEFALHQAAHRCSRPQGTTVGQVA
jgi:NADH:ubiquinone oxidoreductase subunit F (NADH-binding)